MTKQSHTITTRLVAPLSEFSSEFAQAMANRMAVSFHKYGPAADAGDVDCLYSANLRIAKYLDTGNTEWLVDAANFLMMEFMRHPGAFRATDSDESPGRARIDGTVNEARNT